MLPQGSTIGILGGGQLGKMTAQAATALGYKVSIYSESDDSPAAQVTSQCVIGSYDDTDALEVFAKGCDVITFEFENVPAKAAELVSAHTSVYPNYNALYIAQNRLREKKTLSELGIPVVNHAEIKSIAGLETALKKLETRPCLLKTCEQGYDGKGQVKITSSTDLKELETFIENQETVLEAWVDYDFEMSVIVARNQQGHMRAFPPARNIHEDGILRTSEVPSGANQETIDQAMSYAKRLAESLDVVGLITLEFFVLPDGSLIANEIAPRPHNSGHWTMDGCVTSQFEQLVRAIAGMPLGAIDIKTPTTMKNVIGEQANQLDEYIQNDRAKIYMYGKKSVKTGRKMGHVNIVKT